MNKGRGTGLYRIGGMPCLEQKNEMEKQAKELTQLIDEPINTIAKKVKDYEEEQKKKKKEERSGIKTHAAVPPQIKHYKEYRRFHQYPT